MGTDDENDTDVVNKATTALLDTTRDMLTKIIKFSVLRCRRDHLWNLLFTSRPTSSEPASKDRKDGSRDITMSIHELKELLSHVHIEKLDSATKSLREMFESSNVKSPPGREENSQLDFLEWQNRLINILQDKYWKNHRLISSDNGQFKHLIILNHEETENDVERPITSRQMVETKHLSPIGGKEGLINSYFTLMVFDQSSGKITCSLVSKDRRIFSDSTSITNSSSDAVNTLNQEVEKLSSKMIVSAGCFNVWKGLFK